MKDDVRVRMYEVGFGDCFLLEFPRKDWATPFRVLVDCGAHSSGYPRPGWKPEQVVDQIISDVKTQAGTSHVDVVVATHRHQDHVVGFRAKAWSQVSVGEVWLPWTENPKDPLARAILNRQSRLAFGLNAAFLSPDFGARWTDPDRRAALRDLVKNSLTNASAMRTLHTGFLGKPKRKFLSTADPDTITPEACPGLTVHVIGPSKKEDVIRDMDPPAGQSYLRFFDRRMPMDADAIRDESFEPENQIAQSQRPFPPNFTLPASEYEGDSTSLVLDAKTKEAAASFMREDDLAVAVSLDKAVNGTSLMLMFEFGDAFLLFPGDAQWGTWRSAMDDPEHRELLARTTFLKVGHHGSHNATPKEFVEEVLGGKLWCAATSVRSISFWPEIPKADLLTGLGTRSERVIRSDKPGRSKKGVSVRPKISVDFTVPH
jgi:hypothetical protein